ncbi:MAG: beta-eliminating lyase-related protein, partial [Propionicimonas sp.]
LGGGWRQAGILAAAADYALDHHVARLADDHLAAQGFAAEVAALAGDAVDPAAVHTNIVVLNTGTQPARDVVAAAAREGVLLSVVGEQAARAVTHLDVSAAQCAEAGRIVGGLLARA